MKNLNPQVTLLVKKGVGTRSHQKKVWERSSHAFPPHCTPVTMQTFVFGSGEQKLHTDVESHFMSRSNSPQTLVF